MCVIENEYSLSSIKDYIEAVNSVIANVMEDKYSIEYGLACAVTIFKNFSASINKMDLDLNHKDNMRDTLEVYMTVDFLYKKYIENARVIDGEYLGSLGFPFIPKGTKIVSLIYMKKFDEWGCTYRIHDGQLHISFNKDLYFMFNDVSSTN